MTEEENWLPTYYVVQSVRHQSKKTNELLNQITAKVGCRLIWTYNWQGVIILKENQTILTNSNSLFFQIHGNKYANYLELKYIHEKILKDIVALFPNDFQMNIIAKKGLL